MVLAYRYVRTGYDLVLTTRRFNEAEVLQALVDTARFTTVVADDGQMMTEMSLSVRNNGRQFLEVELPRGAKVWSAFVAGQAVRPRASESKWLLPIQTASDGASAVSVELTYAGTNAFPQTRGQVDFVSPRFDVPVKNASWEIYLPPDYDYDDFRGTMMREVAAAQPLSTSFSQLEYARMEQDNKASMKAEVKREVSEAEQKLSGGSMREAVASFNRAKANAGYLKDKGASVADLEKRLNTAQASNLIEAQNEFMFRNSVQRTDTSASMRARLQNATYDNNTAERQWMKLQQAQEVVAPKVQPLRVNLPVRGRRLSFSQVLQTEIGKPMTIQLLAKNAKAVSWSARIVKLAAVFVFLWAASAVFVRMTRREAA